MVANEAREAVRGHVMEVRVQHGRRTDYSGS